MFYRRFNVTPGEVGVDKVSALLRLIPLTFFFAMVMTADVAGLIGVVVIVKVRIPEKIRSRINPVFGVVLAALILMIFYQSVVVKDQSSAMRIRDSGYVAGRGRYWCGRALVFPYGARPTILNATYSGLVCGRHGDHGWSHDVVMDRRGGGQATSDRCARSAARFYWNSH